MYLVSAINRAKIGVSIGALLSFALFLCVAAVHATERNAAAHVYETAKACVGKEMWKPGYGLSKGTLGCAAAVCNVLKKSGTVEAHSAGVTVMRNQLLKAGCKEYTIRGGPGQQLDDAILLRTAKPGDVLVAFKYPPGRANGGPDAHCGIIGQGTTIYSNNWNDGIWTELNIHLMFDYYPYVRVLRFKD
jgi:hypothetical protein